MDLMEREIRGYYMLLLVVPIITGLIILIAAVAVIEWILRRATGRSASLRDLRSIAGEVVIYVGGSAVMAGMMSILGLLPGLVIAWLIVRDSGASMFKLAAPIATLIGLSILLIFFRKKFLLGIDRKTQGWWVILWVILGVLFGASWPVIGVMLWLRYPY